MDEIPLITIKEGRCGGRPCFAGTRIEPSLILEQMRQGATVMEIRESYPRLSISMISFVFRLLHPEETE